MYNNYINKLTDDQLKSFLACYVKNHHIALLDCYDNCNIDVQILRAIDGRITAKTILSDNTGSLEERWTLTDFRVYRDDSYNNEIAHMTRSFARYVYGIFFDKDRELASNYRKEYVERIKANMESEIAGAKHKFQEKMF